MSHSLVADAINNAKNYRDRLILIHGLSALDVIHAAAKDRGQPVKSINLELSEQLLLIVKAERTHGALDFFTALVSEPQTDLQMLIHPEILFDPALAVDPIRLFLNNARNTTLVVQWPGKVSATSLSYATPGHPEYRSWRLSELGQTILINADEYQ